MYIFVFFLCSTIYINATTKMGILFIDQTPSHDLFMIMEIFWMFALWIWTNIVIFCSMVLTKFQAFIWIHRYIPNKNSIVFARLFMEVCWPQKFFSNKFGNNPQRELGLFKFNYLFSSTLNVLWDYGQSVNQKKEKRNNVEFHAEVNTSLNQLTKSTIIECNAKIVKN